MGDNDNRQPRTVTREELYKLVWETPMATLAESFGVSGNGLAKACRRIDVPYPPRGYWAKVAAGKVPPVAKLPKVKSGSLTNTQIWPTPATLEKPEPPKPSPAAIQAAAAVAGLTVPSGTSKLHPIVQGWLNQHREDQRKSQREKREHGFAFWGQTPALTERDLYRFRVSSAIVDGVELAGGTVESGSLDGKVVFVVGGQKVPCTIAERMVRSREVADKWTAYPHFHASNLTSSGFLRVEITTWLRGGKPRWEETERTKIADLLPDIVGAIIAAGPTLELMAAESEERQRQWQLEAAAREEARRQRELDEKRWKGFRGAASAWAEADLIRSFLGEIEARAEREGGDIVGDRTVREWAAWARQRLDVLDPLSGGPSKFFQMIADITLWS